MFYQSYSRIFVKLRQPAILEPDDIEKSFFLNFDVSILLELELSLAQFLYPTYFKSSLDLGIK